MNFNNLAQSVNNNVLNESVVATEEMEGRRGRAPNPEIDKLVKQGMPYWKARAMVRKGMAGASQGDEPAASSTPAASSKAIAPSSPVATGGKMTIKPSTTNTPEYQKTQAAVDEYMQNNPQASVDDVVQHIIDLNDATPVDVRFVYITSPQKIKAMMDASKEEVPVEPTEPAAADVSGAEDEDVDRLTNLFMKLYSMPKDQRAEYMRKLKAAEAEKEVEVDADEDEEEDEVDPYVSQYVKGMKGKEEDEEEFNEPKED